MGMGRLTPFAHFRERRRNTTRFQIQPVMHVSCCWPLKLLLPSNVKCVDATHLFGSNVSTVGMFNVET